MSKRILAFLLALSMIFSLVMPGGLAFADDPEEFLFEEEEYYEPSEDYAEEYEEIIVGDYDEPEEFILEEEIYGEPEDSFVESEDLIIEELIEEPVEEPVEEPAEQPAGQPAEEPATASSMTVADTFGLPALPVAQIGETQYETLQEAIDAANSNAETENTIILLTSVNITTRLNVSKTLTIEAAPDLGFVPYIKINNGDNRVFDISENTGSVTLTLRGVYADGSESGVDASAYARGISMYGNSNVTVSLDGASASSPYYAINVAGGNTKAAINMSNSSLAAGWAALNVWSPTTITVNGSTLSGTNDKTYNGEGWNNFGTIVMNQGTDGSIITMTGSTIKSEMTQGNRQLLIDFRDDGITATFNNCIFESTGTPNGFKDLMFLICESENLTFKDCTFKKGNTVLSVDDVVSNYLSFYSENDPITSTITFHDGEIVKQVYYYETDFGYGYVMAVPETVTRDNSKAFTGGVFYGDPSANVAPGYVAFKSGDVYNVRKADADSTTITVEPPTNNNGTVTSDVTITVGEQTKEVAVTYAPQEAADFTANNDGSASIEDPKTVNTQIIQKTVSEAVIEAIEQGEDVTDITATISVNAVPQAAPVDVDLVVDLAFSIKAELTVTSGDDVLKTATLTGADFAEGTKHVFKLPVPDQFAAGTQITVKHTDRREGLQPEYFYPTVQAGTPRFVEVTVSDFSSLLLSNGSPTARVGDTVMLKLSNGAISYYETIDAALAEADNGSTISLLDKEGEWRDLYLNVDKTFTLDLNGHDITGDFLVDLGAKVTLADSAATKAAATIDIYVIDGKLTIDEQALIVNATIIDAAASDLTVVAAEVTKNLEAYKDTNSAVVSINETYSWVTPVYTITYTNIEGATNPNPTTYNIKEAGKVLSPATWDTPDVYNFANWRLTDEAGVVIANTSELTGGNVTLYATWTPYVAPVARVTGTGENADKSFFFTTLQAAYNFTELDDATVTIIGYEPTPTEQTSIAVTIGKNWPLSVADNVTPGVYAITLESLANLESSLPASYTVPTGTVLIYDSTEKPTVTGGSEGLWIWGLVGNGTDGYTGGYANSNANTLKLASGYIWQKQADNNYQIVENPYVAYIEGAADPNFTSLGAALDAVHVLGDGKTVKLLKDVTYSGAFNDALTLDLDGHAFGKDNSDININANIAITNAAKLNLDGIAVGPGYTLSIDGLTVTPSEINEQGITGDDGAVLSFVNGPTFSWNADGEYWMTVGAKASLVDNGVYRDFNSLSAALAYAKNNSVNAVSLIADDTGSVSVSGNLTLTLASGATFTGTGLYAITVTDGAALIIDGEGAVANVANTASRAIRVMGGGSLTLEGGTFSGKGGSVIVNNEGSLSIEAFDNGLNPTIIESPITKNSGATVTITSGLFAKDKTNVRDLIGADYAVKKSSDEYDTVVPAVATVGGVGYATLAEAIDVAKGKEGAARKVVLVADPVEGAFNGTEAPIIIDMNGIAWTLEEGQSITGALQIADTAETKATFTGALGEDVVAISGHYAAKPAVGEGLIAWANKTGETLNYYDVVEKLEIKLTGEGTLPEGVTSPVDVGKGYAPEIEEPRPTWAGHDFTGWKLVVLDENGQPVLDANNQPTLYADYYVWTTPLEASITLQAVYDETVYTFNFANEKGVVPEKQTHRVTDTKFDLPVLTAEDFEFMGYTYGEVTVPIKTVEPADLPTIFGAATELTFTASWAAAVATVTVNGGDPVYFSTLKGALTYANAAEGDSVVVKLVDDFDETFTGFTVTRELTLDLQGKSANLTGTKATITVKKDTKNNGKLTILDTVDEGADPGTLLVKSITNSGEMTVEGGIISSTTKSAITISNSGTLKVNGGSVVSAPATGTADAIKVTGGTAELTGGDFVAESGNVLNLTGGTLTVSGGRFKGALNGTMTISGGKFSADPSGKLSVEAYMSANVDTDAVLYPYLVITDPVVIVNDGHGDINFKSAQNAFDYIESLEGAPAVTLTFVADETLTATYEGASAVTISFAQNTPEFTWSTASENAIFTNSGSGKVTFGGSNPGTVKNTGTGVAVKAESGPIAISGAKYSFKAAEGIDAVQGSESAVVTLSAGNFYSKNPETYPNVSIANKRYSVYDGDHFVITSTAPVAQIGDGENPVYFATLQKAVDAVKEGETIYLLKNNTITKTSAAIHSNNGFSYTIDLNGYTWGNASETAKASYILAQDSASGTITIIDSSEGDGIMSNKTEDGQLFSIAEGGEIAVTGGMYDRNPEELGVLGENVVSVYVPDHPYLGYYAVKPESTAIVAQVTWKSGDPETDHSANFEEFAPAIVMATNYDPNLLSERTLTLENDVTIAPDAATKSFEIWQDLILDLNGHSISYTGDSVNDAALLKVAKIEGYTLGETAVLTVNAKNAADAISANHTTAAISVEDGGGLVLNGGSITNTNGYGVKVAAGCTLDVPAESTAAVEGKGYGVYAEVDATTPAVVSIEGGTFTGTGKSAKAYGKVTKALTGGTYSSDPKSYLAKGYSSVKNDTDPATWSVVPSVTVTLKFYEAGPDPKTTLQKDVKVTVASGVPYYPNDKGEPYAIEGYQLVGWYDEDGNLIPAEGITFAADKGTATLTSDWTAETYTVTFAAGDGIGEKASIEFTITGNDGKVDLAIKSEDTMKYDGFFFKDWRFDENTTFAGDKVNAAELIALADENKTIALTAEWTEVVATVTIGDGMPVPYGSLSEANTAANDAEGEPIVVTLMADATGYFVSNKNMTFDLNGFTLTNSSNNFAIRVNKANTTLTVTDSSTDADGKVVRTGTTGDVVKVDRGSLVISGGSFSGGVNALNQNSNGGSTTIEGGTFDGPIHANVGTIEIKNGFFTGNAELTKAEGAVITVKGGNFVNVPAFVADGYGITMLDDESIYNYSVASIDTFEARVPIFGVENDQTPFLYDLHFTTLAEAFRYAEEEIEVKPIVGLDKDIELQNTLTIEPRADRQFIGLNLSGFTISSGSDSAAIIVDGNVDVLTKELNTIAGVINVPVVVNGQIKVKPLVNGEDYSAPEVTFGNTLTMNAESTSTDLAFNGNGVLVMYGGTVENLCLYGASGFNMTSGTVGNFANGDFGGKFFIGKDVNSFAISGDESMVLATIKIEEPTDTNKALHTVTGGYFVDDVKTMNLVKDGFSVSSKPVDKYQKYLNYVGACNHEGEVGYICTQCGEAIKADVVLWSATSANVDASMGIAQLRSSVNSITLSNPNVTITAPAKDPVGYAFKGWFVKGAEEEFTTAKTCEITEFPTTDVVINELRQTASVTYIAVYESLGAFTLNVSAPIFSVQVVGGPKPATSYGSFSRTYSGGTVVEITWLGGADLKLDRWVNGSGQKIAGNEPASFTYTMNHNVDITAIFSQSIADKTQAKVVFYNASGFVKFSQEYTDEDTIDFPSAPYKGDQEPFLGWYMTVIEDGVETEVEATQDSITEWIASDVRVDNGITIIEVTPQFTERPMPAEIYTSVVVDDEAGEEVRVESAQVGKSVTITAADNVGEVPFAYWATAAVDDEGNIVSYEGNIVSYEKSFSFIANSPEVIVFYAIYKDEAVQPKPAVSLVIQNPVKNLDTGKTRTTFEATRVVPEGYTVIQSGVLYYWDYAEDVNVAEMLTLQNISNIKSGISDSSALNGTVTVSSNTSAQTRVYWARAFVTTSDGTVTETTYSNVQSMDIGIA